MLEKYKEVTKEIESTEKWSKLDEICILDSNSEDFVTFNEKSLSVISEFMPHIVEKRNSFGRQNSFHTNKLMTLHMMTNGSPMRMLRQCISEIESKRRALRDNVFRLKKNRIKLKKLISEVEFLELDKKQLERDIEEKKDVDIENDKTIRDLTKELRNTEFEIERKNLSIEEKRAGLADSRVYIEGALKDIASFQDAYQQILKNKNIPEDWNERDFEGMESRFHVRMIFFNAYRDIKAHGNLGMGTMEYMDQFGISPDQVEMEIRKFLTWSQEQTYKQNEGRIEIIKEPEYEDFKDWLDFVEEKYKDNYKKVMERVGLDEMSKDWYTYQGYNKS